MDFNEKFFVPDDGNEVEETRARYHEIAKFKRAKPGTDPISKL